MNLRDSRSLLLRVVGRRFLSRPIKLTGRHILVVSLLASATISLPSTAVPRTLPEYNATEAKNHIGETARVTDKVGCIESRHWGGKRVGLGDCGPQSAHAPFMAITYSDVIPGPKLDLEKLKGVVVTVTGKIKEYGHTGTASIDVTSTSQIVPHKLKRAQVEANAQQSAAKPSSGSQSGSQPISAEVVDIPAAQAQFGIKAGNVKVTFSDGHTEVWTHSGDCHNAKVSPKGNVGWILIGKRGTLSPSGKTIALDNDSLVVRLLDGTTKKFPPFGENHFIPDWRFADDDKAVIVRSGGYHGPASYVQYDLASGKVIDSRGNGYTPYAELPAWAKPLADPNEWRICCQGPNPAANRGRCVASA